MPNRPDQPHPRRTINDDLLAALVEGDLSPAEERAAREALRADPRAEALVASMRRDRDLLRALGDEPPPPGMSERVQAALEREALVGLSSGPPLSDSPPVWNIPKVRRSGRRFWLSPAGAGLSMAAVLALAGGVTLLMLRPPAPKPIELASNDNGAIEQVPEIDRPELTAIAADSPEHPNPIEESPAFASVGARAPSDFPSVEFDDAERAAALLREGRLLVRVRAPEADAVLEHLDALASRSVPRSPAWRLAPAPEGEALASIREHVAPPIDASRALDPWMIAGDDDIAFTRVESLAAPVDPLAGAYLADTRVSAPALASLTAALSDHGGARVTFEELNAPMPIPDVITTEALLWWSRPVRDWTPRANVPIVVERADR